MSDIEDTVRSWGMWGIAASIGLMIVHSFIPFPAEFVAIANGMAYGPLWGTVVTWIGAMCGALVAFALSRALGRPFVEQMIVKKDWQQVDRWVEQRGGHLAFFGRFLSPDYLVQSDQVCRRAHPYVVVDVRVGHRNRDSPDDGANGADGRQYRAHELARLVIANRGGRGSVVPHSSRIGVGRPRQTLRNSRASFDRLCSRRF